MAVIQSAPDVVTTENAVHHRSSLNYATGKDEARLAHPGRNGLAANHNLQMIFAI